MYQRAGKAVYWTLVPYGRRPKKIWRQVPASQAHIVAMQRCNCIRVLSFPELRKCGGKRKIGARQVKTYLLIEVNQRLSSEELSQSRSRNG